MNVLGFAVTPQPGAVTSVTVATDDSRSEVGIGHVVTITLNTAVKETVTGTPTLQLNDGEVATYVGGSGTSALQFAYTVQPGDNIANLQVTGVNLTGGATILDSFDSSLSTNVTANLGVQVITLVTNLHTSADNLVYLLYQASFARIPDYAGFEYWAGQADARQFERAAACRHIHGRAGIHRQIRRESQQRRLRDRALRQCSGTHAVTPGASPIGSSRPIPEWRGTSC